MEADDQAGLSEFSLPFDPSSLGANHHCSKLATGLIGLASTSYKDYNPFLHIRVN